MSFRVVLDANVIVCLPVCDTMLRLAEADVFDVVWSGRLLDEAHATLTARLGVAAERAAHRISVMRRAFPLAMVGAEDVDRLEPHMANNPEDRHILAAAVAGAAQAVVTFNLRDFPRAVCKPFGVDAIHPDEFLVKQLTLDPHAVRAALVRQASELRRPPVTLDAVLDNLHAFVPRFVEAVRALPLT